MTTISSKFVRTISVFALAVAIMAPATAMADGKGSGYSSGSYTPPAVSSGSYTPSYSSGSYKAPTYSSGSYTPSYSSGSYKPTTYSSGSYKPTYSSGSYYPTYSSGSYKPTTYSSGSYTPTYYGNTVKKPLTNYSSVYKTPTYSTGGYYDNYKPVYYDNYDTYGSSCGYAYDCGSSGSGLNLNLNYNSNDNSNTNTNNNVITIGGGTTTTTHSCAEYGQEGTYPNCHIPHQPTCADYGETGTYPNCHDNSHNSNVSCNLDASDTSVSEGDRVTLSWDTSGNPNYASINQGVGSVDTDSGSERVTVDNDTTYRLTVRNSDGDEDTCSVTVRVDNSNNFSSVSFTGEPTNNPPVVYLSDIPYTGLEDINPVLLSYWLMLVAAAGAGVWFLYRKGMIPTFAFATTSEPIDEGHMEEAVEEGHVEAAPEVLSFLSALDAGDTDAAIDQVRDAAANGTGVEEFLASAEVAATDADLQAKVTAALEASRLTGLRGAKAALA